MPDKFSHRQEIRKPAICSDGGIVAAQSRIAAEIGAAVLASGGDCVDAVIATSFAIGVVEPWMSGVGSGGAMVLHPGDRTGDRDRAGPVQIAVPGTVAGMDEA